MLDAERRIKQYIKERLDSRQKRLKSRVLNERQKRDAACEICELKRLLKYMRNIKFDNKIQNSTNGIDKVEKQ